MTTSRSSKAIPFSMGMVLVTMGVVYGDIGTSPMYTLRAIMHGNGGLDTMTPDTVIGALSLIIWTMTLITTVKYVLVAMKADNHNEGGIFALYSLVRRCGGWLIVPAMIGGAALLADGILTPAVTVTTAIEGLRTIDLVHGIIGDDQTVVVFITIELNRQGLWTHHVPVVRVSRNRRPAEHRRRPQRASGVQPYSRHHVPV